MSLQRGQMTSFHMGQSHVGVAPCSTVASLDSDSELSTASIKAPNGRQSPVSIRRVKFKALERFGYILLVTSLRHA